MKRPLFSLCVSVIALCLALPVATAAERPDQQKLIEGAKAEGEVVVWTHSWRKASKKVTEHFRKKYPFLKVKIWDSRTVNITNKAITEVKAGKHTPDVILIVSRGFPRLRAAGVLQEYDWPEHLKRWTNQPNHRYWVNIVANFYIPTYNSKLVSDGEAPKAWEDLKNPKWKGKSVVSSSSSGTPLLFAHMWRKQNGELNWEKAFAFWREVIKNTKPKGSRGFGGPTELLVSGEYSIFLLNSIGVALRTIKREAPLKVMPVPGKIAGTSWSLAMPKTVPHPNAAKLFIDYLVSPEGLVRYANAHQTPVLDPEVAKKAEANIRLKEMGIDWYPLPEELVNAKNLKKATNWWATTLGVKRGRGKKK